MKSKFELPRPGGWIQFESLCLKLWGHLWEIPHTIDFNSTNDQGQNGVDIVGIPKGEKGYFGVQCKSKQLHLKSGLSNKLTKAVIDDEIKKAASFQPSLKHLVIATSLSKDKSIETYVREVNLQRINAGLFTVQICFWEFISDKLQENENLKNWYLANGDLTSSYAIEVLFGNNSTSKTYHPEFLMEIQNYRHITKKEQEDQNKGFSEAMDALKKNKELFNWKDSLPFKIRNSWGSLKRSNQNIGNVKILIDGKPPKSIYPYQLFSDRTFSLGLNEHDFEPCCFFSFQIKNMGLNVIEDYKIEFEVFGAFQKFDIQSPPLTQVLNKTYQTHSFKIADNKGLIKPDKNLLVQQDTFRSYNFYIKPIMIGESKVDINWKLISRDYSDSGTLTLFVKPKYEKKESIWIIDPKENAYVKYAFRYLKKKGALQPNL